jgi:hypothetical protein
MRICLALAVLALASPPPAVPTAPVAAPIFRFETGGFWLNLHHFLYVLGRAEAATPDSAREAVAGAPADAARGGAQMTPEERVAWAAAVLAYSSGLSRKDVVFDDPLPELAGALARAGDRASLEGAGVDPLAAATLESVAGVYRRVWWPAHRAANERWTAAIQPLLDRHGDRVLAYITRAYAKPWPAGGYPVQVAAYSNWAGAYSTKGNLLVLASLDPALGGLQGLETVFHEAMHQWDDEVWEELIAHARRLNIRVSGRVTHAMIFYTAGEAVRSVEPSHVPYAEAAGVWGRGMAQFKRPLVEVWKPWLDGQGTRDAALAALAARAVIPR